VIDDTPRTAFNLAPLPNPDVSITSKDGVEKYSVPPEPIVADEIPDVLGSTVIFTIAFFPFLIFKFGFFSKFNISDPYPVPLSISKTSSISPLTTGVMSSSPEKVAVVFEPPTLMYFIEAFISGYLNI